MSFLSTKKSATPKVVAIVLMLWFLGVAVVGHTGVLVGAPTPFIGGYVMSVTLLFCILGISVSPLRSWLLSLELRFLVLLHVVRFVGIALLVSSAAEGGLPQIFADRAGYGDIFTAITALALAVGFLPAVSRFHRRLLLLWNVVGIVDLLQALGTAQLSGSSAMAPIISAPLAYLPLYLVPLLMFVHIVIFYRLAIGALDSESTL
ncbi:hypothetical protein N836_00400 [Leptolyngbya sp. Heron Island J]|uniref:hypothetical protein n=1 Tax=Leptolyngbya sp. Heron Island J TaxID=1385935 RepID=UPI0003B955A4|nr:hypothetical protein [Leptolyngbya sp. Heron Island J]ESA36366.1 hypothetical protein N836_00400 [Leptolyngbya sp. Heron Island J]